MQSLSTRSRTLHTRMIILLLILSIFQAYTPPTEALSPTLEQSSKSYTQFTPSTIRLNGVHSCGSSSLSQDGRIAALGCNDAILLIDTDSNSVRTFEMSAAVVALSPDGRYLAFVSGDARVLNNKQTGWYALLMYDTQSTKGILESIKITEEYSWFPMKIVMTQDGSKLLFARKSGSKCDNMLEEIILYDRETQQHQSISCELNGHDIAISNDGSVVFYTSFSDAPRVCYSATQQSSFLPGGTLPDGTSLIAHGESVSISADGRFGAFEATHPRTTLCPATHCEYFALIDLKNPIEPQEFPIPGNNYFFDVNPMLSPDGQFVAFQMHDLASGLEIKLYDIRSGAIEKVSVYPSGQGTKGPSNFFLEAISNNGCMILFRVFESNYLRKRCEPQQPTPTTRNPVVLVHGLNDTAAGWVGLCSTVIGRLELQR